MCLIDIRVSKHIGDSVEDRILLRTRFDYPTAGLTLVMAPVAYPTFAKHTFAKTT